MSRHIKIGEKAPLRRLKVGQYFKYPHWYVIYRLAKSVSNVVAEQGFILKFRPTGRYNHSARQCFPVSNNFTEIASIADGTGGYGVNTIVKVVAKPRAGEGFETK